MQITELGGISLLSAFLMLWAAVIHASVLTIVRDGPAAFRRGGFWRPVCMALLALLITLGYGRFRLDQLEMHPSLRVALIQASIPQSQRSGESGSRSTIIKHATMSLAVKDQAVDLVVWPESAVRYFIETSETIPRYLTELTNAIGTPLLLGSIGLNPPPSPPSNSAFVVDASGEIAGRADKNVLVPFAETLPVVRHVPFLRRPITDLLSRTMHFRPHLEAGTGPGLVRAAGRDLGVLICYDDVVPGPAADQRRAGAEALVTLSNEAYFGDRERWQHAAMATARCIETRLPMARATHTGQTCIIDPAGRITDRLPHDREGILYGDLLVTSSRGLPSWIRTALTVLVSGIVLVLFLATYSVRFVAWAIRFRLF
jgi:apolipoprotein N-acyltransferase